MLTSLSTSLVTSCPGFKDKLVKQSRVSNGRSELWCVFLGVNIPT